MDRAAILNAARRIARENDIEVEDLDTLLPEQQVALIRDRLSRHVLALQEELLGLTADRKLQRVEATAAAREAA